MTLAGEVRATVLALRGAAPQRAGIAMRTMVCVALPLAIGVAAGHPRSGATASFGGLAGLYVPQSPYRYRASVVAAVGAGLAIAVLIGSTAGSRTWVAAMVTGVVAAVASFVCQAAELPPPRELMLIMVLLAATAVPAGLAGAAQRAGLAAAGAALAWLVTMSPALGRHPPIWLVVIAVALFQGLAELAIATNYGVAVADITVLALLLFHVAAPGEAITTTIGSRLLDTGIGAILALLLRRLLWPRATLRRLPSAQALTLQATSRVLAEAWAPQPDPQLLADRRRALQGTLAVLRAVHADATADAGLVSRSTDTAWPVSAGIEELARLALSWPAYRPRPEPAQAAALRHHLEELASAIAEARPPDTTIPALPGQPLTEAATAALTSAVVDAERIPASR